MRGGVASRCEKVDGVPERAAAEAEAPALELPAIGFPRDGAAPALARLLNVRDLSYARRRHGVCPPDRMYSVALSLFLSN